MGPAEWLLYRYRGDVAALRATATPAGFLLRSAGVLALCLLAYLLPLLPAALLADAEPAPLLLLAATLWTALLLQAFGVAWTSAGVCLAAAGGAAAITLLLSHRARRCCRCAAAPPRCVSRRARCGCCGRPAGRMPVTSGPRPRDHRPPGPRPTHGQHH